MLKLFLSVIILSIGLYACSEMESTDQIIGTWEWSSGSRIIEPTGFERLHRDRNDRYLVGDSDFDFVFDENGSFTSAYTLPGKPTTLHSGNWSRRENLLLLDYAEPASFTGISQYIVPSIDESNLDLRWSVEYLEFTDTQIKEFENDGTITTDGWIADRDSLLIDSGETIRATITLHFVKGN